MTPFVVAFTSSLLCFLAVAVWVVRRAWRRTVLGVMPVIGSGRKLQFRVHRLEAFQGIWNPARPMDVSNRLFGAGEGIYELDQDADEVTLRWRPRASSELVTLRGPVPDQVANRVHRRRHTRSFRIVLVGAATAFVGGGAIGVASSHGATGQRLVLGAVGAVAGMVALWLAVLLVNITNAVRNTMHTD